MLYMSQAKVSRTARRRAWLNRPPESLDTPVKRYLANRSVGSGSQKRESRRTVWRRALRPAF